MPTTGAIRGPFHWPLPGPDEIWEQTYHNRIYNGLVLDGCGTTPVFPVDFHSEVNDREDFFEPVLLGEFDATDNTTLQPTGFWTFFYKIRVTLGNDVSDFKFSGTVSATCTNLESLD